MDTALNLLNLTCAIFTFVMVIFMLVTFRKPRTIGRFAPLLSALLSLLLLGLFWLLSGAHLNGLVALPIFVLGLGLGGLIGLTARLYPQGNRVMGRHSWLFLAGWGFSLVLAQLLVLTGWPLAASLGLIPLIFSTGSNVGRELSLFIRRWMMSPGPV